MEIALKIAGLVLGFFAGFGTGLYCLMYMTKGENVKSLLADKDKKIWLGTFGWFTALVGAWAGWQGADWFAYALR
jgi:hypothetical protein